ncbi:unnamed protein product [Prunus armeniaca]
MECERCIRIHAGLLVAFWIETVNHASYLVNWSPLKYLDFKCAEDSLKCIFLGFESGVKGFKLWDLGNKKKKKPSREVVFDEKTIHMIKVKKPEANEDVVETKTTVTISPSRMVKKTPSMQPIEDVHEAVEFNIEVEEFLQQQRTQDKEEEQTQVHTEPPSITRSRSKRTIKPPQRFGWETDTIHYALNLNEGDPTMF